MVYRLFHDVYNSLLEYCRYDIVMLWFFKIYLAAAIEFFLAHWSLWSQGRGKALEVQSYECWDLRGWCWWEEINFFKNFYFILTLISCSYKKQNLQKLFHSLVFLAVQDSSIGDLVTHSVSQSVSQVTF